MNMRPLVRRFIVALLLVALTACYSWRSTIVSPQRLISEERPSSVRVMLTDGTQLTLYNPTLRNDTIISGVQYLFGSSRGAPVSDVSTVEVRRFSVVKTIALGVPLILVATGIIFLITCEEGCLSPGG